MWWFKNLIVFTIFFNLLKVSISQTKDDDYHECVRSCADNVLSKKVCRYEFFAKELSSPISIQNGSKNKNESMNRDEIISSNSFLGINGKSPGPQIEVCLGDTIEVLLYNRLGSEELSFHWHGMRQKNSAHMDGVPMVTQCSILPFGGFRYKLKPENIGTYMYYAHIVSQQGDGVYGSLTVRGPQNDRSLERILLLSSRPSIPLSRYSYLHPPTPRELLLNGQNNGSMLRVHYGTKYFLRVINANAYNCPVLLSISGHDFRVLAVDGNPVEPTMGRHVVSFPATTRGTSQKRTTRGSAWSGLATRPSSYCANTNRDASSGTGMLEGIATVPNENARSKSSPRSFAATPSRSRKRSRISSVNTQGRFTRYRTAVTQLPGPTMFTCPSGSPLKQCNFCNLARVDTVRERSDIDPESITFIDCNEETNGSGSLNASLSEDAEESSCSSLKAMEPYNNGLLQDHCSPGCDLDESDQTKLEVTADERKRTKEEFAKFAESIAVQLAEIPDSYSRSVAKLRINQILFEAEIGVYAQTRERFDMIVEANQPPGKYHVDIEGLLDCQNLRQEAFILYDNTKPESAVTKDDKLLKINDYAIASKGHDCHQISKNFICALDLKGSREVEVNSNEVIYIPFDVNAFSYFTDEMSDYKYNFYGCPFYPSSLSTKKEGAKVAQINRMSFKYPMSPLLSQPENTPEEGICYFEKRSKECADTPLFCECVHVIEVPPKKNIDIVLIDEGFGGNVSHTFHIHGYNASVLGKDSFERAITKEEIILLDRNKQLHRNFLNPPQKDSFVVPNKGYIILRLFTDNLGYWLWEARSTAISPGTSGPVMQFLLKVGSRESFLPVPLDFPTCGSNKHPDMVFETN
ncbi:hypothetical protein E2986_12629 [Frieseomelitta varia]|uniref:Laccase n=1 Tax=Frieseomelitta varia TaxID=561572 RepID=A0A833RWF6_9HYME|nr:hypothetical protein E2986_12629 [Frieseomelitta varia]